MSTTDTDPRLNRLYQLLPAVYRQRDADQKYPLQALLRVIAEQVNVVEDDMQQLYENWFIETAEDWVVPYIADLIGYRAVSDAGQPGETTTAEGLALNRVLIPRREWPTQSRIAGAREPWRCWSCRKRRGWLACARRRIFQAARLEPELQPRSPRPRDDDRFATRRGFDLIGRPFDPLPHTVDVRRINSHRTIGRYNIPSVGVFVWRLRSYSVTQSRPHCTEDVRPNCYTFSVLSQDAPLFLKPEEETEATHIAEELNVPAPIRRLAFAKHPKLFYGVNKSLAIWAGEWAGYDSAEPVPVEAIVPADLSDWQYAPPLKHVAVDPVLGRFAFPLDQEQLPKKGVRVMYHYGFSAALGGGEYARPILDPSPRECENLMKDSTKRFP
jgi:hypothetical protein